MRNVLESYGKKISYGIDFFHPPFRSVIKLHLFRYGITGSANLIFDWVLYFLLYNYLLHQKELHVGSFTLSSHIATLAIKFPIVLLSGFLLQKYVTFSSSEIRGRIALFRYMVVVFVNLLINYIGLKLLVEQFGFYPTLSNMAISIFTVFVSYFFQKLYTFKMQTAA